MAHYFATKDASPNGEHQVHRLGCSHNPDEENQTYLGSFFGCCAAVHKAREYYLYVNGCMYCSRECHTS